MTDRIQTAAMQTSTIPDARLINPLTIEQVGGNEDIGKTRRKTIVAITVSATGLNALLSSLVIVTFPTMASDLHMTEELLLW